MNDEVVRMKKKVSKNEGHMESYKNMVKMMNDMKKFEKWIRYLIRDEIKIMYKPDKEKYKKVLEEINKRDEHPRCKKCGKYLIVSWGDAIQHNASMYCRCHRRR
jgi:lipopolysaccharide biosynthesis regulator YciM